MRVQRGLGLMLSGLFIKVTSCPLNDNPLRITVYIRGGWCGDNNYHNNNQLGGCDSRSFVCLANGEKKRLSFL